MIRKLLPEDREIFLQLADDFYHSPAVLYPVPREHLENTFAEMVSGSPYTTGFLFEQDGRPAGYAIIAFTYSNEAGGIVLWIEEIYIPTAYRGHGLGSEFLHYIETEYRGRVARLRLEVERDNKGAVRLYERMGYHEMAYMQMIKEKW